MRWVHIFDRATCTWIWKLFKVGVTVATFNGIGDCGPPPPGRVVVPPPPIPPVAFVPPPDVPWLPAGPPPVDRWSPPSPFVWVPPSFQLGGEGAGGTRPDFIRMGTLRDNGGVAPLDHVVIPVPETLAVPRAVVVASEPAGVAIVGLGLVVLGWTRRRREAGHE